MKEKSYNNDFYSILRDLRNEDKMLKHSSLKFLRNLIENKDVKIAIKVDTVDEFKKVCSLMDIKSTNTEASFNLYKDKTYICSFGGGYTISINPDPKDYVLLTVKDIELIFNAKSSMDKKDPYIFMEEMLDKLSNIRLLIDGGIETNEMEDIKLASKCFDELIEEFDVFLYDKKTTT